MKLPHPPLIKAQHFLDQTYSVSEKENRERQTYTRLELVLFNVVLP